MFTTLYSQIGAALMASICGIAMWKGRWAERLVGAALFINWVGCDALQDRRLHHHAQPAMFALDIAYDAVLLMVLLRTPRQWAIWAFAFQTNLVLTHVGADLDPVIGQWDFFIAYYVWSYAMLGAVAWGALSATQPSWSRRARQAVTAGGTEGSTSSAS